MFCVEAISEARPEAAWSLLAEPARWSSWAPHIRGAVGLGSPEVQAGRRGFAIVAFVAAVPVRVGATSAGRFWDWQTGPVRFRHSVEPHPDGCLIRLELHAPPGLEQILALTYGPLIRRVIARLATVAAQAS